MREAREVNHHAAIRISQRAQQLARRRRSVFASEHGHAGQAFERAVVSFRIDGTHAIAVQNQLLAQQARDPGLSGLGVAGHQHVAAANREREFTTVLQIPEQQTTAAARGNREIPGRRERSHIVADGRRPAAIENDVGGRLQCLAAPGDGDADFSQSQELVVVFGVTDRDGVARRKPQRLERHVQPGRLAHALRRCHHTPAVEDQHEWQFECPNDLEQPRSLVGVRIDQALSSGKGNPATAQFGDEAPQAPAAPAPRSVRCPGSE